MADKWHSGRMILALVRHYDWFRLKMFPEIHIDGSQADLLLITPTMYATEIEIKVSLSDWNADAKKAHWQMERPHVSRFFYAVPEYLAEKVPAWVPAHVGILVVRAIPRQPNPQWKETTVDVVHVLRQARRRKCQKVPPELIESIHRAAYYRFWRFHFNELHHRLANKREKSNGTS